MSTVQSEGWAGTTNGALLNLASEREFIALISADKNIASQHNKSKLPIAVVVLSVLKLRASTLIPLIPEAIAELKSDSSPRIIVIGQ